jgi:hypothetical protein
MIQPLKQTRTLPSSTIITALFAINSQFRQVINGNLLLKDELAQLMYCIWVSKSHAAKRCEKIINHVIAEVSENAGDDERFADESPCGENDDSEACRQLGEYLKLQQALKDFRANYLTQ